MKEKKQPGKSNEDDVMSVMQAAAPWKARYRFLTYEEADAEIAAQARASESGAA